MTGVFIAVEGIDGCGKTGFAQALAGHLTQRGNDVVATREPGGSPQGDAIRALILSGADDSWDDRSELLLMTAARIEHVRRTILPALDAGRWVVCDRFVGSTIAYQGAGRGLPVDFIRMLHARTIGDFFPDLTVVLDLDAGTGLARSRKRLTRDGSGEDRFERLTQEFHARVRQSFLDQAAADRAAHVVIDASGPQDQVIADALAAVDAWLDARG